MLVTPLVTFALNRGVEPVTCTVVHPIAGKFGTARFNAFIPTVNAELLVTPAQVPPKVDETILMFVSVSVKSALVSTLSTLVGLQSVNVTSEVAPVAIQAGLKVLVITAGCAVGSRANAHVGKCVGKYCPLLPECG